MNLRVLRAASATLVVVATASAADAQCAMCKAVLISSPEGRALSSSLNHGILLMLAAPYLVAGTFAAVFFRKRWQPALAGVGRRLQARLVGRRVVPQP